MTTLFFTSFLLSEHLVDLLFQFLTCEKMVKVIFSIRKFLPFTKPVFLIWFLLVYFLVEPMAASLTPLDGTLKFLIFNFSFIRTFLLLPALFFYSFARSEILENYSQSMYLITSNTTRMAPVQDLVSIGKKIPEKLPTDFVVVVGTLLAGAIGATF